MPFRFILRRGGWYGRKYLLSSGDSSEVEESSASCPLVLGLPSPKFWEMMVAGRFLGRLCRETRPLVMQLASRWQLTLSLASLSGPTALPTGRLAVL